VPNFERPEMGGTIRDAAGLLRERGLLEEV